MPRRNDVLASGALALGLTLVLTLGSALGVPAAAQQPVASTQLDQVDSWGVGWLGANDNPIPTAFWANTNSDALAPIFGALQPKDLSPAGREALRRIVLSKSKTPVGGAVLAPERLRLMEQLGEAAHAAELRKRYTDAEWGKTGERLSVELELVNGRKDACGRIPVRPGADASWMPLRAFCAALNGDFNAASLIGEQIAEADEGLGVWLLASTANMQEATKTKPVGRYATAFDAAVSLAAKLSVPANGFVATPPDVAASIARNPMSTLEQKRAALRAGLDQLRTSDVVGILTAKPDAPENQTKPAARAAAARPDLLALALEASTNAEAKSETRAAAYAGALNAAESLSDARLAAAALIDAIRALPRNETTQPHAEVFARAALLRGDAKLALDWRKTLAASPKDKLDDWALARLDLMFSYAGLSADKPGAILDRLLAAAPPPAAPAPGKPALPAAKSPSAADKQLELRRIENTRVLFLYAGTGRDLAPGPRALLATQKTAGRGVSDAAIARIVSAADQGAPGEAALAIISLLGADTSALSFAGLSDLLALLRRVGLERDADAIALESLQVWKGL